MRIMVDTNFLVSALFFPNPYFTEIFKHIRDNCILVLCVDVLDELLRVTKKKFPHNLQLIKTFFLKTKYELYEIDENDFRMYPEIRDLDDKPILASAIKSGVDIFITGDPDYDDVKVIKPRIMKPRHYFDEFLKNNPK